VVCVWHKALTLSSNVRLASWRGKPGARRRNILLAHMSPGAHAAGPPSTVPRLIASLLCRPTRLLAPCSAVPYRFTRALSRRWLPLRSPLPHRDGSHPSPPAPTFTRPHFTPMRQPSPLCSNPVTVHKHKISQRFWSCPAAYRP
jgi:hypothetical protein